MCMQYIEGCTRKGTTFDAGGVPKPRLGLALHQCETKEQPEQPEHTQESTLAGHKTSRTGLALHQWPFFANTSSQNTSRISMLAELKSGRFW